MTSDGTGDGQHRDATTPAAGRGLVARDRAPDAGTPEGPGAVTPAAGRGLVGRDWAADADGAQDDTGTEVGVEDLAVDPRTAAEALCLCALLWTGPTLATQVVDVLAVDDFHAPPLGELFVVITIQVRAGRPHDPASIASAITIAGGGHRAALLLRALADTTIAGAGPETTGHYATAVAAAAYRRGYAIAAAALTHPALEPGPAVAQLAGCEVYDAA